MADDADRADECAEQHLAFALSVRKPVPTTRECGEPCAVLPNGARAKYCNTCLCEYIGAENE